MNIRWLKRNLLVIIFGVVFATLLGVFGWLANRAGGRKVDVEGDLQNQKQALEGLQKQVPYPSTENIQALRSDRDRLQQLYTAFQGAVMQEHLKVPEIQNEIDFVDQLRRTQASLRDLASSHGVDVRPDFAFGFAKYSDSFPCRNPVLKPDDCRKVLNLLMKQMLIIEKVCQLAMGSGIDAITAIRRTEVEGSGDLNPNSDTFPGSIAEDPKARFQRVPFDIQFICTENALQNFLNAMTQSDWFFTVETVKVSTDVPVLHSTAQSTAGAGMPQRKQVLVTMRLDLVVFPSEKPKPKR